MIKLAQPVRPPLPARPARERALIHLALLGAVLLWLWALPALLMRDGFILSGSDGPRGSDACLQSRYRDPVTGRLNLAPSIHHAARTACVTPAPGARP